MRKSFILAGGLWLVASGCDLGPEPASSLVGASGPAPEPQVRIELGTDAPPPRGEGGGGEEPVVLPPLAGSWRPFADSSPWNTPIPPGAALHSASATLMATMIAEVGHIGLARVFSPPVWVVDSRRVKPVYVRSDRIFDFWDTDWNGWSDVGVPWTAPMWPEPTADAHITIIDSSKHLAWEMSRFALQPDGTVTCTTFNIWDLRGPGHGDSNEGNRWGTRGGRGSGFPIIAGLLRPEEIAAGEIRHALTFSFPKNRRADDSTSAIFIQPPACRSDGQYVGAQYPIMGMRLQLDPAIGEADFAAVGLTPEARIVARALQSYGMYLADSGGAMKIEVQILSPSLEGNRAAWDALFPGLYTAVDKIPTHWFRVIDTGPPTIKN